MDHSQLLHHIRSGNNREALKELYKPYPAIRHFIRQHGGNEEEARDIFQESLLVFYKNALKADFQLTSALGTYLFAVSKYLWKDELKRKNRKVSFEITDVPDEVIDFREQELRCGWLDEVVTGLGDKCRQILELFYYRKFSMEQIAKKLDYKTVDSVKTQKYKCLGRAREMATRKNVESLAGGV